MLKYSGRRQLNGHNLLLVRGCIYEDPAFERDSWLLWKNRIQRTILKWERKSDIVVIFYTAYIMINRVLETVEHFPSQMKFRCIYNRIRVDWFHYGVEICKWILVIYVSRRHFWSHIWYLFSLFSSKRRLCLGNLKNIESLIIVSLKY